MFFFIIIVITFYIHVCLYDYLCVCVCRWRGEGWRHPQTLLPIYAPQETPPSKDKLLFLLPAPAASRETAHPSVSNTLEHSLRKRAWLPKRMQPNVVVWFTCSGVKAPSLRAGLQHQNLPLTGHMTLVSLTWGSNWPMRSGLGASVTVSALSVCVVCFTWFECFCILACVCVDIDLDAVVTSTEKLSHPTASRPRVTDRRPRSQIVAPVSVCSQPVRGRPTVALFSICTTILCRSATLTLSLNHYWWIYFRKQTRKQFLWSSVFLHVKTFCVFSF